MSEIVLINITGKDRKGLDAKFTGILSEYNVNILDISQEVIHDYITFGILAEIPDKNNFSSVYKNMVFESHKMELTIGIKPIALEEYEDWVQELDKERRTITLLGKNITADQIFKVTSIIAESDLNIESLTRLSGRISIKTPQKNKKTCIKFSVSGKPKDIKKMRSRFVETSKKTGIDISFHIDNIYSKNRKLVVFDMDSTLIQTEVIDELAKLAGTEKEVAQITKSAMQGKIDFKESFIQRLALLKGIKESELPQMIENLPFSEGVSRVTQTLKKLGYKLGIISGGFTFVGKYIKNKFGFDYVYANELEIKNGRVTGKVIGDIIDGNEKARILKMIAEKENISIEQTIAVGDGANDIPMIGIAGLGVAYNAKQVVLEKADNAISSVGLDGLLYLMGMHKREIED